MVNTLIPTSAIGCSSAARIPVSEKSSGPSTANAVNGPACWAFLGTLRAAQTTLVSRAVAVIENSEDDSAQAGTSAPAPSRTTASFSGNCSRVRDALTGSLMARVPPC